MTAISLGLRISRAYWCLLTHTSIMEMKQSEKYVPKLKAKQNIKYG
jgi:hypothetical protein